MTEEKQCPLGTKARFCKYQETYAYDALSAAKGELLFLCILDKTDECPELNKILKGE